MSHHSQHKKHAEGDPAEQEEATARGRRMVCKFHELFVTEACFRVVQSTLRLGVELNTLMWLQGQAPMEGLQIGELARQSGCPAETIRYYEREGLLPSPVRSTGNYRLYSSAHSARLAFIRNCRALDMTLDEIRALLNIRDLAKDDCSAAHELLDDHISHVSERIQELEELQKQLLSVRRSCSTNRTKHGHCAILDDLAREKAQPKRRTPHVKGSHKIR